MNDMDDLVPVLIVSGFVLAIAVITGKLAARKGYSFWSWFFAAGILGLLVLAFQPHANGAELSTTERIYRTDRGNRIGRAISGVSIAIGLMRMLAAS